MKRIDLHQIYLLGSEIIPLSSIIDKEPIAREVYLVMANAKFALNRLIKNNLIDLDFSKHLCQNLLNSINKIYDNHYDFSKENHVFKEENSTNLIDSFDMWILREAYRQFEPVFKTEIERISTYVIAKKGIYETQSLVKIQ